MSFFSILLISGCSDSSERKILNNWDDTPPQVPKAISLDKNSSARYSKDIELRGEPGSAVVVNGKVLAELDENGYAKVSIPLKGEDGLKSVKIELEDAYGNRSEPIIIKIYKDTTAPVVTLNGDSKIYIALNSNFTDPGAKAVDNLDGELPVEKIGRVDNKKSGTYILKYRATDRAGNSAFVSRIVYVKDSLSTNHAPEAKDDTLTIDEDRNGTIDILANDSDADGDALTIKSFTQPTNGVVKKVADKLLYTPKANYNGSDSFSYTITDGEKEASAKVNITVNPVNDAPVLEPIADVTMQDSDTAKEITLHATDIDSLTLSYEVTQASSDYFTTTISANKLTITPKASGESSVTVTVKDDSGATDTKSFKVKITHINHAPEAKDDTLTIDEDRNGTIDILANDSDADGDALTIKSFTQPTNGVVKKVADKLLYTPKANYNGSDSFSYTITDGEKEASAKVNITVNPVNDAPVLEPIADVTMQDSDTAKEIKLQVSDVDAQANELKLELSSSNSELFNISNDAGFNLTITPIEGKAGESIVTVKVKDAHGASDTKSFKVTINHTNLAPEYQNTLSDIDTQDAKELNIDINGSFKDPEGEALTYSVTDLPQGLSFDTKTDKITGTLTKEASSQSPYSIKVKATDPEGLSSETTFKMSVQNPSPEAKDDNVSLVKGEEITVDVLANDIDPDGDTISIKEIKTAPANGTAKVENGKIVYTPNSDFTGNDNLIYEIIDAQGAAASATVTFIVTDNNHAPEYIGDKDTIEFQSDWHNKTSYNISSLFTDEDNDTLTFKSSNMPDKLSLDSKTGVFNSNFDIKDMRTPIYDFNVTVEDSNGATVTVPMKWTLTGGYIEQNRETSVETVKNRGVSFYPYKDVISAWDINYSSLTIKEKPSNGEVWVDFNGTVIYRPNNDFTGSETIKYNICDNQNEPQCTDATVSLTVADIDSNSSVQTNWGFQEFEVPNNSVTLKAGDDIQNALNTLSNKGGGKLILAAGEYNLGEISLPSNVVIEGAGIKKTILKANKHIYHLLEARDTKENIVIRGVTLDCRNQVEYGCLAFNYGTKNVLVENIEVFGAGRSDISAYNENWTEAGHFTVRDNIIYSTVNYHGISMRFIKGAIVANNIIYKTVGDGIDMSRVIHGEVTNNSVIDTGYGTKFPGSDYLYMHDNYIDEVWKEGGIKFNPISEDYNREHIHIENNTLKHTRGGIVDWGDSSPAPHFAEFVAKGNIVTDDYNKMNMIRVKNGINLYDYGNDVRGRDGQTLSDEFENIFRKSATDSPQADGVGYKSWGKNYSFENKNIYKPTLDFSVDDVYGNGNVVEVSTTRDLENAIADASEKTTILLNNGTYSSVNIEFPKGLHDITLKAKGDSATIEPKGYNDESAFTLPNVAKTSEQVHNINFIGLKIQGSTSSKKQFIKSVHGRWVDSDGNLHDYGDDNPKYGPYNIYFKNIDTQDLFMGLYSGLYAHDWTIDNCTMKGSTYSHFWYMMGWHLAVVNSTFEDATHDALAIRGYYPEGEVHTYIANASDTKCYGNKYVEDRAKRDAASGFLAPDTWTHTIKNNTFKRVSTIRDSSNVYIALAYSVYSEDPVCGAEKTYLPPQNVEISGNFIDNNGEDEEAINSAIALNARAGLDNSSKSSVNGVKIVNNKFYKNRDEEQFLITDDNNTDLTVLRSYQLFHNITTKNN